MPFRMAISRDSDYCETDVLNTWLVYLRFQLMRGELDATGYDQELALLQDYLKEGTLTSWRFWRPGRRRRPAELMPRGRHKSDASGLKR